ncbi:MAG: diguanylate cyclase [Sulfurimonas sp.]|nr:diguanylate cyclase [Sulfurimonas sp.]
MDRFHMISENIYVSLQNDDEFLDIFSKAVNADKMQRDILRDAMYKHLINDYRKLRMLDVMQIHLLFPDNKSFLRMHKPSKYGDDLSDIRYSIKSVNDLSMHIHGFEGGKTSHGFREVYPIYKDGLHIGVLDVVFSSTVLQSYTMRASGIHTHFLVNKDIFNMNEWEPNIKYNYYQSMEHKDFLFSMSHHINNERMDKTRKTLITPSREIIDKNIKIGKAFAIYRNIDTSVIVAAFLPIKNIKNDKVVAYLVSYSDSTAIVEILKNYKIILALSLFFVLLITVLIYSFLIHSRNLKEELQFDALTKVFTRKHFMYLAENDYKKAKELGNEICIVMMDIDFFKNVNDTYGHQCGDDVLKEMSELVSHSIRKLDFVGRYGGEEFILVINADSKNTKKVIENIRKKVQEYLFCGEENLKITASFGIAEGTLDKLLDDTIKKADIALYRSKDEGRNRVTIF